MNKWVFMGKKNVVAAALILILQFSVSMHLTAQDLKSQTGIYFGYNLLNQVSNFKTLPGLQSCCENFTGGGGYGLSAGALHRMFFSKFFGIGLRLGYNQMDGTMTKQEFIGNAYDSDFNTVEAISEYTLETYLRSVEVMPLVFIRPFDMPLTLNAGLSVGYTFSGTDNHTEELVDPVGAQFINGSKYRKSSNDIGDIFQPSVYIRPGVTYDIKISGSLILSPEIWAGFPIFNTVKNTDWKTSTIGLTAALKYVVPDKEPEPPAEPPLPPMPEPPPPPEAPPIGATVEAYAFNNEVGETNLKGIIIQEYLSKRIYPLLNYIFFDDNSAAIPARYVKMPESGTKSFSADKFFGESTLDVYYEILNIIGYRMRRNPGATLTVTGCNSNTGDEAGDLKLSRSRAETIKDFLQCRPGFPD